MRKRQVLTPRRRQILEYIQRTIQQRGYPPTVREIGRAVGLSSTSTVHFHLRALEEAGYLQRDPLLTRAIRPTAPEGETRHRGVRYVPVVGRVAAGQPILADENIEEYVPLPEDFANGEELFMLRVRGDSMIGDGIMDGDYVIVRRQDWADPGDIVVALVEDEATVKRIYVHEGMVELRPSNPEMSSIFLREVRILGKVVGLLRRM